MAASKKYGIVFNFLVEDEVVDRGLDSEMNRLSEQH